MDPKAETEVAVRKAIDLAMDSFSDCLVAMPACDPGSLAVARAGDLLARNQARITEWNGKGYTVRKRENFRYVVESVTLADSLTEATARVCFADGSALIRPNAAPDGSDVIVDDEFVSGREDWHIVLGADGVWRVDAAPAFGSPQASDACAAG